MIPHFRTSEWMPTRRAVWGAVLDMDGKFAPISLGGPIMVRAIHPDPPEPCYSVGVSATPQKSEVYMCELWRERITLYGASELPRAKVRKVYDGKNDDTFYVSEQGEVFIRE